MVSDQHLMLIARYWGFLSPDFRRVYLSALSIPAAFEVYNSPGGHFEVYFIRSDTIAYTHFRDSGCVASDTVDDTLCPIVKTITDTAHDGVDTRDVYGFASGDWRNRANGANGVPDYIDEVAWALDSAWSMEIDRFGFKAPYPFVDASHGSGKYKVVVRDVEDAAGELYGMTFPLGQVASGTGIRSFIEVRNDWSGPDWERLGYNDRPLDAAHVTCVHEFFHAIQFAMGHEDQPYVDNFPIGWLEATAVLMEELGFDDVNDCLNYKSYFSIPTQSLFVHGSMAYDEWVVPAYLYRFMCDTPSIAFFRTVFEQNERAKMDFAQNLYTAASALGTDWTTQLNRFHVNSFFTGGRADTSRFIKDAVELPSWKCTVDTPDSAMRVAKTVYPWAMNTFTHRRAERFFDTLYVQFAAAQSESEEKWAAQVILRDSTATGDIWAVEPVPLVTPSSGLLTVPGWGNWDEVILVLTNGDRRSARDVDVFFTDFHMEELYLSSAFEIYPNPVMIGKHSVLKVRGRNVTEVRLYSIDGNLVARADVYLRPDNAALHRARGGFDWMLCNKAGDTVVPGTYIAVISHKDPDKNKLKLARRSVLVLP